MPAARARWLLAWLAVSLSPFAFRAALVVERLDAPALVDARGFASDAFVSLAVLGALAAIARLSRVAVIALGIVWVLMQGANYETVSALGTPASIADAQFLLSGTFLLGSATAITHPILALLLLAATSWALWAGLCVEPRPAWRAAAAGALAGIVGTAALAAWPSPFDVAGWRPAHALQRDARLLARALADRDADAHPRYPDAAAAMLALVPEMAADFRGEPRVPLPDASSERPNVLLVVVESISGEHVDRLARAHDRPALGLMPELDGIAGDALAYGTFFAHNRKTNRGLYALLCGELPNLRTGLPKMSSYPEGGRTCLPEILARAGYETWYLQAAPLAFMLKDRFMPRIGFARVDGGDWFQRAYARSAWGVDDRAFFEGASVAVEELASKRASDGRPWFLTLLTVGTHHPFVVPPDYRPPGVRTEVERTLRYADEAIGAFDRRLRALDVLDDTLVIYTSDESLGPTRTANRVDRLLGQSWGFLVARVPGGARELVLEPFAQVDVAASILDYVGLADDAHHLFGRSVFRHYPVGRYVFFANTNAYWNGMLDPYGRLAMCMLDFESCRVFRPAGERVFGPSRTEEKWDPARDDVLREMTRRSVDPDEGGPGIRALELLTEPTFVADRRAFEVVHGGQYLTLAAGDWVEVELVARAEGERGARAELEHRVESREQGIVYEETAAVAAGETLTWRYRFGANDDVHGFGARSYARTLGALPVKLVFDVARITLHRGEEPIEPGFRLEELAARPAQRPST